MRAFGHHKPTYLGAETFRLTFGGYFSPVILYIGISPGLGTKGATHGK